MSFFDDGYERFTGSLNEGGASDIPRHRRWVEVPAGVAAPGVFAKDGRDLSFWILLESHPLRKEQSILQKAMGKRGEMNIARGSAMVREAMLGVADFVERLSDDELEDSDEARTARMRVITKAEREWFWKALSQRGRNLVTSEYDKLTEPATADEEGND